MMKILLVLLLMGIPAYPAFAQKVEVDLRDLNSDARNAVINANAKREVNQESTVDQVRGWVGLGKEVGAAVDGALGAVINSAEKFGKTEVGRFTMFLVMWRFFGNDMLRAGVPLL